MPVPMKHMYIKGLFSCIFLSIVHVLSAQDCGDNVVINGDFETPNADVCDAAPDGPYGSTNQIPRPWYDQSPVANWIGTAIRVDDDISYPTADYFGNCTNTGPNDQLNGNGSMGYHANFFQDESSEYIQQRLAEPLIAGREYCVSVIVHSGKPSRGSIDGDPNDGFGLWFHNRTFASGDGFLEWNADNNGVPFIGPGTTINATQTVGLAPGENVPTAPTLLTYKFCAEGGEEYLVIGNFNPGDRQGDQDYMCYDDVVVRPACPTDFDCNINVSGTPDCAGGCVDLTAEGLNPVGGCDPSTDFSYLWSSGETSATINVCPTVTTLYSVDITYFAGCEEVTKTCEVSLCGTPITTTVNSDTICEGDCTDLLAEASGGSSDLSYSWDNGLPDGPGPHEVCPTATTTYCVTVEDNDGNTSNACGEVTVLSINGTVNDEVDICRGESVNLLAGGGSTYLWSPDNGTLNDISISNPTANPVITTDYQVIVGDADGLCSDTLTTTVHVDSAIADAGPDVSICEGGSVELVASGGGTYRWSPDDGTLSDINRNNPIASPLSDTDYIVEVTSNSGLCTDRDTVRVSISELVADAGPDFIICLEDTVQLQATGGVTYSWTPDDGSLSAINIANPLAAPMLTSTYQVVVSDASGNCSDTAEVTITVEEIVADAGPDTSICGGSSIQLQGSGGGTYLWSPDDGSLDDITSANPTATLNGVVTYTLTVTSTSGTCSDQDSVNIQVGDVQANAGMDDTICRGENTPLRASGGTQYTWSPNDGTLSDVNSSNPTASPLITTTYTVTVSDATGACSDSDEVTILVDSAIADAGPDVSVCDGGSVQLQAGGGASYQWTPDDGTLSDANISNPVATPTGSQVYTVLVTSTTGACTDSDEVLVEIGQVIADAGPDTTICRGQSVTLNASGGDLYQWMPNDGTLSNINSADPVASPLSTITYSVVASDLSERCRDTAFVTITVEELTPAITAPQTICLGEDTDLSVTGGASYIWTLPDGSFSSDATITVAPTISTSYPVQINSLSGVCRVDTFTVVTVEEQLITVQSPLSVCRDASVQLIADAPGAITYSWTPAQDLNDPTIRNPLASPQASSTYTVTATNANDCEGTASVDVIVIDVVATAGAESPICLGTSAQLQASGGSQYRWTPAITLNDAGSASPLATPLTNTRYTVTVSDDSGNCQDTASVFVQVESVTADAGSDTLICLGNSVTLSAQGGSGYQWSPVTSLDNPNIANPVATPTERMVPYIVTVFNDRGCSDMDTVIVTTSSVSLDAGVDPEIILEGEEVNLLARTNAGTIEWSEFNSNSIIYSGVFIDRHTFAPDSSMTVRLIGINDDACSDTTHVSFKVLAPVKVPNVFTPNEDGYNDTWQIANIQDYEKAEIRIFNRWGNLVFKTGKGYNNNWSGTNNRGKSLPIGTYYYRIKLNFRGYEMAGDVTILR